jgi:hypothetical protein
LEHAPRDPDDAAVFPDLDHVLHGAPVTIVTSVFERTAVGNHCPSRYPAPRCDQPKNTRLGEDRMRRSPEVGATAMADEVIE